jgi:hypothetical protein
MPELRGQLQVIPQFKHYFTIRAGWETKGIVRGMKQYVKFRDSLVPQNFLIILGLETLQEKKLCKIKGWKFSHPSDYRGAL